MTDKKILTFITHGKNGFESHDYNLNDFQMYARLLARLLKKENIVVNKDTIYRLFSHYENYIIEEHEKNKNGDHLIDHYYSVDIYAELFSSYIDTYWDKIEEIINTYEIKLPNINRVEVIKNNEGRVYTNYNVNNTEISFQDNHKTMKIFIDYEK